MPVCSKWCGLLQGSSSEASRADESDDSSTPTSISSSSSFADVSSAARALSRLWKVMVWGGLVLLASTVVVREARGTFSDTKTLEYITLITSASLALPGPFGGQSPPLWVRSFSSAAMLVITILISLLPWLTFGIDAWRRCDRHSYKGTDKAWFLRPGLIDLSCAALITPAAMACVASWHPPSSYSRGAVICIILIWLNKLGWVCVQYMAWCGNPVWMVIDEQLLTEILTGVSMGLLVFSKLMQWLLLVLRIESLEDPIEQKYYGPLLGLFCVYCLLQLANDLYEGEVHWRGIDASTLSFQAPGQIIWIHLLCVLFPISISALIVRAFLVPLRVLAREERQLRGAPQAWASWAVQNLRRELAGALCLILSGSVRQCLNAFSGFFGTDRFLLISLTSCLDDLCNVLGTLTMCGLLWQSEPPAPLVRPPCRAASAANLAMADPAWHRQVERLGARGFTLEALLDFLELLLKRQVMPSFSPRLSTTNDVVRQAIIPLSRGTGADTGGYALATVWNAGRPVLPQRMVTHNWENTFLHLVASIVADGLDRDTYATVAEWLVDEDGVDKMREKLLKRGALGRTYWVCAFSVNQHAGICGGFGPPPSRGSDEFLEWTAKKHDSVTGLELPVCTCHEQKFFSDTPVECEMNKFDDMMAYLFQVVPDFGQVVAVDTSFKLFTRAWCVAELAEADAIGMSQSVKIHSESSLESHYSELSLLDVRECRASRVEDKDFILARIGDIDIFNSRLQWLVFGAEGLFSNWADTRDVAASIGMITRWAMART